MRGGVVEVVVLVDEEGDAVDGGFFGEDFLVFVVIVDGLLDGLLEGLFEDVVLVGFSIFAWLFVLGVGLGVGLGLKFGGGGRFRRGDRVNGSLGLGLGVGFLDLYLNLGFNGSLLDDFGFLGVLTRLLDLNLGFNGSLLDDFGLLGVLTRLLDFGFIARCVDEILNDVLVGNVALNGDGLLGARLANLGLLDGLVLGGDELLHDLGIGRGL